MNATPTRATHTDVLKNRATTARDNTGGVLGKRIDDLSDLTDALRATGELPYYSALDKSNGPVAIFEGREILMLGSNGYLGLSTDERVRRASADAVLEYGTTSSGSAVQNGYTVLQRECEQAIAAFVGREDAMLTPTGYQANTAALAALMNRDTVLIIDAEAHASIFEGAKLSGCTIAKFSHNDLTELQQRLAEHAHQPCMVMVEGVYSMSADVAPLPEIKHLCVEYDAALMVDDAHGLGMVGETGRGAEEMLDAIGCADVLTGTFSKSLASVGGWIAGDHRVIEFIRFTGKSAMFSAAAPPSNIAAALAALDIINQEPWRLKQLGENVKYWQNGLKKLGFTVSGSQTAIVSVMVGEEGQCMKFWKALMDGGLYANCVIAPASPRGKELIRTSVIATHEQHHLDRALEIFKAAGKKVGLI